jgi:hypothetical protein
MQHHHWVTVGWGTSLCPVAGCLSCAVCVCVQSTSEPRVAWLEEQLRSLGLADGPAGTGLMMGSLCAGKFSLDGNW